MEQSLALFDPRTQSRRMWFGLHRKISDSYQLVLVQLEMLHSQKKMMLHKLTDSLLEVQDELMTWYHMTRNILHKMGMVPELMPHKMLQNCYHTKKMLVLISSVWSLVLLVSLLQVLKLVSLHHHHSTHIHIRHLQPQPQVYHHHHHCRCHY